MPVWDKTLPAHASPMIGYALNRIEREFGDRCEVNRKDLNKFGGNPAVGVTEVSLNSWGADEVFQTSNVTLKMSSSSASDTSGVFIEYAFLNSKNEFEFAAMQATLDGQNKVTLPSAAARWMRMYTSGDVAGDVYIYRDGAITAGVPDDLTTVHNAIPAGDNQSQKAGTTITHSNYFLMSSYWADVVKKTGASITIKIKIREFGGDFRSAPRRGASDSNGLRQEYDSYFIVKPGSDIVITATSSVASTDVTAGFNGMFADIV